MEKLLIYAFLPLLIAAYTNNFLPSDYQETKFCEFYNKTCDEDTDNCPDQEICDLKYKNQQTFCFVIWANNSDNGAVVALKGCFSGDDNCIQNNCVSTISKRKHKEEYSYLYCCCLGNYCNENFIWQPSDEKESEPTSFKELKVQSNTELYASISATLIIFIIVCIVIVFRFQYRKKKSILVPEIPILSAHINLLETIGHGRYGKIAKADCEGKIVAIKVLPFYNRDAWSSEREIYDLPQIKNDNILELFDLGLHGQEVWFLTAYHSIGSLQEFLRNRVITWSEFLHIARTMTNGLFHLHSELPPTKEADQKPIVAHRDFKSKNVLLKSDLSACIADFGLARVIRTDEYCVDLEESRVGTIRYMAPELLEGSIDTKRDSFLLIDMYAFGLVLWELMSRCEVSNFKAPAYQLPFENLVGKNPTLDNMYHFVVMKGERPLLQKHWHLHPGLKLVAQIMKDCWDQETEVRLASSTVVQLLSKITSTVNDTL